MENVKIAIILDAFKQFQKSFFLTTSTSQDLYCQTSQSSQMFLSDAEYLGTKNAKNEFKWDFIKETWRNLNLNFTTTDAKPCHMAVQRW